MKIITVLLALLITGKLSAQKFFQKAEFIEAGVFIHSIGIPFTGESLLNFNNLPGINIGTSIPIKTNNNWQTDYRMRLSGHLGEGLLGGLHLDNQIAQTYLLSDYFRVEGSSGLGYYHTFEDAGIYDFSNGAYQRKRDYGRSQITISLGLGFSFRFNKNSPYWVYSQQQILLQIPFASKSGVPMLIHSRTHLGVRREINFKYRNQ